MSNSYRPRRTRIYNANYDIGESYYKKQLQDLDHKRDPLSRQRREMSLDDTLLRTDRLTPKVSFSSPIDEKDPFFAKLSKPMEYRSAYIDNNDEEDDFLAKIATKRASAMKKLRSPSPDEFDSKVTRALSQARQIKSKYLVEEADDDGLITALPPRKNKFRAILDGDDLQSSSNAGSSSLTSSVMSSTKRISRVNKSIVDEESADSVAATRRANSTRARLADLESEMENMSFKQNEREKRSLNLRKLIRDSESVDVTM